MKSRVVKNRIKLIRAEQHISQEELARRSGMAPQTLLRFEQGDYGNFWKALSICQALNKSLDDVFYFEEGGSN